MTAPRRGGAETDAFVRDLAALAGAGALAPPSVVELATAATLLQLSAALDPVAPTTALRARLFADIPATGRLARYAEAVAELLDIGRQSAHELLDKLEDKTHFSLELPGIEFFWVDGGPRVANAVRGFLRVAAGAHFPDHEHLGDEHVLVLQGSFIDSTRGLTFHAGDRDVM
ncbi:MAG: hypothetical protein RL701_2447, partial [Pseudomonadota bacterium]